MASDDTPYDRIKAVLALLAAQGVKPTDDAQPASLPPIMADPRGLFESQGEGPTISLLTRLGSISNSRNAPQITQYGFVDSPGPKDAAE